MTKKESPESLHIIGGSSAASRALALLIALTTAPLSFAQLLEDRLSHRAALIAESPHDPQVHKWLADQASDLYFEHLAIDGSGWTMILGIPSVSQRQRAIRAGREIYQHARRAEIAIEQAILDLERTPGFADNLSLQRERRRLTEEERDRRIPFLIGVGASVRAHAEPLDDVERTARFTTAHDTLAPLAPHLTDALAARARVHAGFAALALRRHSDAESLFDQAADDGEVEDVVRFAARLGGAAVARTAEETERRLQRLAAAPEYSKNIFYRLLIADRAFMLKMDRSLREAVQTYADLLALEFDVSREAARDIIFARIADAVGPEPRPEELPPFAHIAAAERAMRNGRSDSDVRSPLEAALQRNDLTDIERGHALLTLARVHHSGGDHLAAAQRYIEVARHHPSKPEAERAIEAALTLASKQYRASPDLARHTLHEGLNVALASYPRLPTIDRWKYIAGRLAMNESRYDDADILLASIARTHELWIDGRVMRLRALRRAAATTDRTERRAQLLRQLLDGAHAIEPEFDRAVREASESRAQTLRRHRLSVRINRAAALTGLGHPEQAIELLADLENEADADASLIAETLHARIEAYQAMGHVDEAHREIARFIEQAGDRAAGVLAPMLISIERRVREMEARGRDDRASEIARAELGPLAVQLNEWMSARPNRFDPSLAVRIADSLRHAGQYQPAAAVYDRLLADHPDAMPLLYGKAECLYQLGMAGRSESTLGEAMILFRRIASAGPQSETYWQAHLRTLQILDATNRNTQQIVPQIQRLRLRDPNLGGDRLRAEFERLQNKYAG